LLLYLFLCLNTSRPVPKGLISYCFASLNTKHYRYRTMQYFFVCNPNCLIYSHILFHYYIINPVCLITFCHSMSEFIAWKQFSFPWEDNLLSYNSYVYSYYIVSSAYFSADISFSSTFHLLLFHSSVLEFLYLI